MKYLTLICFTAVVISTEICGTYLVTQSLHEETQLRLALAAIASAQQEKEDPPREKGTKL